MSLPVAEDGQLLAELIVNVLIYLFVARLGATVSREHIKRNATMPDFDF